MRIRPPSRPTVISMRPGVSSPVASRAPMASPAFLRMLVSACEISLPVAFHGQHLGRCGDVEGNLGIGHALQEYGLLQKFLNVFRAHHRRRHAREGREFVDHAPDIADLPDDRVGALGEDLGIGFDLAGIFALEPFGRKLDRRQRILDLMGDTARDIGPGRRALRRDQVGDVVEGDDVSRRQVRCRPAR